MIREKIKSYIHIIASIATILSTLTLLNYNSILSLFKPSINGTFSFYIKPVHNAYDKPLTGPISIPNWADSTTISRLNKDILKFQIPYEIISYLYSSNRKTTFESDSFSQLLGKMGIISSMLNDCQTGVSSMNYYSFPPLAIDFYIENKENSILRNVYIDISEIAPNFLGYYYVDSLISLSPKSINDKIELISIGNMLPKDIKRITLWTYDSNILSLYDIPNVKVLYDGGETNIYSQNILDNKTFIDKKISNTLSRFHYFRYIFYILSLIGIYYSVILFSKIVAKFVKELTL